MVIICWYVRGICTCRSMAFRERGGCPASAHLPRIRTLLSVWNQQPGKSQVDRHGPLCLCTPSCLFGDAELMANVGWFLWSKRLLPLGWGTVRVCFFASSTTWTGKLCLAVMWQSQSSPPQRYHSCACQKKTRCWRGDSVKWGNWVKRVPHLMKKKTLNRYHRVWNFESYIRTGLYSISSI